MEFPLTLSSSAAQEVHITSQLVPARVRSAEANSTHPAVFTFDNRDETITWARIRSFPQQYEPGTQIRFTLYYVIDGNRTKLLDADTQDGTLSLADPFTRPTPPGATPVGPPSRLLYELEAALMPESNVTSVNVIVYDWLIKSDNSTFAPSVLTFNPDVLVTDPTDPCCCQTTATYTPGDTGVPGAPQM